MVGNKPNIKRNIARTKVTQYELNNLDRQAFNNRGITSPKLKTRTAINASSRTVQRYMRF